MYPSSKAIGISHHTGNTDPGNMANTTAITSPKIAIIIHSSRNTITKNRNRVRVLTYLEVYSAIDFPWFLMEITRAPKSCTAPMMIDPAKIQIRAGTHPQITCLLYTSDAADDLLCVDLGGRRIIKKKNKLHRLH